MTLFNTNAHDGTLVHQDPDSNEYEVWFQYDTQQVGLVRKGAFVAVKNFDTGDGQDRYSLLEIVKAHPEHYALGSSMRSLERSFPGFVREAAKSARRDWEQEEPRENTTVIRCTATPSGKELRVDEASMDHEIGHDDALPMIGEEVSLLSDELTEQVVNHNIVESGREAIAPGHLKVEETIEYLLEIEGLLKTHFGVFGFTGAGKSNLLSNVVGEIIASESDVTMVFSDLMGEYTALLADLVADYDNAVIVALDRDSIPGGDTTAAFLDGSGDIDTAIDGILRTLLVPRELERRRDEFRPIFEEILRNEKIRQLQPEGFQASTVEDIIEDEFYDLGSGGRSEFSRFVFEEILPDGDSMTVGQDELNLLIAAINRALEQDEVPIDSDGWYEETEGPGLDQFGDSNGTDSESTGPDAFDEHIPFAGGTVGLNDTTTRNLRDLRFRIEQELQRMQAGAGTPITIEEIESIVNADQPGLIILQSDQEDDLKNTTARLMRRIYGRRRNAGENRPLVSFVLDEADKFIPSSADDQATANVKDATETVARRGRKFGIGVGIATQRATYLDTSIMAQPHTYMISKLPRKEDRDRVGDAFGLPDEVLERTLEFQPGEWLSISYEAAGINGFPVLVRFNNAADRIRDSLNRYNSSP